MRVGILGGGQLGWMTILEGRKLGFEFFVLDKDPKSPACKVADACFTPEQVETFLKSCDVITYEFEHIEQELVEKVSHLLSPSAEVLRLKSSRLREKSFYRKMGYPTAEFTFAKGKELYKRLAEFGLPAVVKAEKLGYDGKGQYLVKSLLQVDEIFKNHPKDENFLVERFVNFLFEFSLIGVRSKRGDTRVYPMTINHHEKGILLYNYTSGMHVKEAHNILTSLMEDLNIVGLLAVEFFFCQDGKVLINEMAPRPHNTGHYTLDGCYTSQFENLLRAITDLPLGSTSLKLPSGMVNLLGVSLEDIDLRSLLSVEGSKLYWYGKEKRERRKMGHINIVANTQKEVEEKIKSILHLTYQTQGV
ncbi:5-(carboxyamino)imidazole ribonucleotide synthase [Hydrogenobacter hydrogenophilus]|uniref:N5-carboxyaminoimidazole ribonucleotide synthase n=1 Tax=Hydrogenobacter hydrogenophilus TaxID=35835 RepID=A0A285NYV1_9AQUI|nr:5-(carboxyamino)imidazole ribonucleotide synthase [Hydrogenobacter hydrogenophilus]SNZ13076.1 5-(carboxyamino)imidazole ribonucleotide synthase [Hydrogenobacter hydrogenophilus]